MLNSQFSMASKVLNNQVPTYLWELNSLCCPLTFSHVNHLSVYEKCKASFRVRYLPGCWLRSESSSDLHIASYFSCHLPKVFFPPPHHLSLSWDLILFFSSRKFLLRCLYSKYFLLHISIYLYLYISLYLYSLLSSRSL